MIPEKMKDCRGDGGAHISTELMKISEPFSEETLTHRCGISDASFKGGCIILDNFG